MKCLNRSVPVTAQEMPEQICPCGSTGNAWTDLSLWQHRKCLNRSVPVAAQEMPEQICPCGSTGNAWTDLSLWQQRKCLNRSVPVAAQEMPEQICPCGSKGNAWTDLSLWQHRKCLNRSVPEIPFVAETLRNKDENRLHKVEQQQRNAALTSTGFCRMAHRGCSVITVTKFRLLSFDFLITFFHIYWWQPVTDKGSEGTGELF